MTLTIDRFIVTSTPEEIDTFIKLYKCTQNTFTNIPLYTIQPLYYTDFSPRKWTTSCEESTSVLNTNSKNDGNCTIKQK